VFDVLVYLYEHQAALDACPDSDALSQQLAQAGFDADEVAQALGWLHGLARVNRDALALQNARASSLRILAARERERLPLSALRFLDFLQTSGQLTASQREIVLERALAVDDAPVSLPWVKLTALLVLWSQQADIDALLLDELLDDGAARVLH
jgi:Smg protein